MLRQLLLCEPLGNGVRITVGNTNRIGQYNGWHALTRGKGVALASTFNSGSTASHGGALDSRLTIRPPFRD